MGATLRELQLCELQMLKDIKTVCEKYNLRYYLSSGTLLGAVRHHGFIPWDDDIDIEMPYTDYRRFLQVAPKELKTCFLQNSDTDPFFHFVYSRIRKNNTTMMREWEKTTPSHHGVWVDIFPMANVGGTFDYRLKRLLVRISNFLRMDEFVFSQTKEWLTQQSSRFQIVAVRLVRCLPKSIRNLVRDAMLRFVFSGKKRSYLSTVWTTISYRIPAEAFSEPTEILQFEDAEFTVPRDYHRVLATIYGEEYMKLPPLSERSGGHGDLIVDLDHAWTPKEDN